MNRYRIYIGNNNDKKHLCYRNYHYQMFATSLSEAFRKVEVLAREYQMRTPSTVILMPAIKSELRAHTIDNRPILIGYAGSRYEYGVYIHKVSC